MHSYTEGDTVPLFVSKGLFNIFVIKYNHISKYTNESSYRNQFKNSINRVTKGAYLDAPCFGLCEI